MRFTVVWTPEARNDLAELWLAFPDRKAVQNVADTIDSGLRDDAHLQGREFFGERLLGVPPLNVTFSVSLEDRLVTIAQVWIASPT